MKKLDLLKVEYIVVHCADTPCDMKCDVETIRNWHVKENGWEDIGYHYIITADGVLNFGRNIKYQGSHVKSYNDKSIGICLTGGRFGKKEHKDKRFFDEQFTALKELLCNLRKIKELENCKIVGHSDLDKRKTCPNFDIQKFIKEWEIK